MSLYFFHIVLMLTGACASLAFALWSFSRLSGAQPDIYMILAIAGCVMSAGILIYLAWFIAKLRKTLTGQDGKIEQSEVKNDGTSRSK